MKKCHDCAVECMSLMLNLQFVHWLGKKIKAIKKNILKKELESKLFILGSKESVKGSFLFCFVFMWLSLTFVAVKMWLNIRDSFELLWHRNYFITRHEDLQPLATAVLHKKEYNCQFS